MAWNKIQSRTLWTIKESIVSVTTLRTACSGKPPDVWGSSSREDTADQQMQITSETPSPRGFDHNGKFGGSGEVI